VFCLEAQRVCKRDQQIEGESKHGVLPRLTMVIMGEAQCGEGMIIVVT
jgi:hypothetical protein